MRTTLNKWFEIPEYDRVYLKYLVFQYFTHQNMCEIEGMTYLNEVAYLESICQLFDQKVPSNCDLSLLELIPYINQI